MRNASVSQLRTLGRCQYKWGQRYLRKIQPKIAALPLSRGKLIHLALAQYHVTGAFDLDKLASTMAIEPETLDQCRKVLDAYVVEAPPVRGEVLAVEWPFQISIPTPRGTRSNYRLIGWIDMIVRTEYGVWVWDHKSGKSFPTSPNLATDAQVSLLSYALRLLDVPVVGTIVNRLHMTKKPKFTRYQDVKTSAELACWGVDLYQRCRVLPSRKTDWRLLPRTPNRNCSWDCEFVDLCAFRYRGDFDAEADLLAYEFEPRSSRSQDLSQYNKVAPRAWREKG